MTRSRLYVCLMIVFFSSSLLYSGTPFLSPCLFPLGKKKKAQYVVSAKKSDSSPCKWALSNPQSHDEFEQFFKTTISDIISLNLNLFSFESMKIFAGVFPLYAGARMIDEQLQCRFYSHKDHKNKNQFPCWCHDVVQYGVGVPIVVLGFGSLLSSDREKRTTGWIYLLGFPFVIFGKDLLKQVESDCNCRPWHETLTKNHKRSSGGFPSGHMAEVVYTATLFGMRFGPKYAVPLSIYAAGLGMVFLNCNRHYLSQFVGGAGLGAMYAIAANKLIDHKLSDSCSTGFSVDKNGNPSVSFSCKF